MIIVVATGSIMTVEMGSALSKLSIGSETVTGGPGVPVGEGVGTGVGVGLGVGTGEAVGVGPVPDILMSPLV